MNKDIVQSLANLTGLSQEEIQTKWEQAPEEIATQLSSIKPFKEEEFDGLFENRLKTLTPEDAKKLPDSIKSELYNTNKASVLEKTEKRILDALSLDYKRGEDYDNIVDLAELIYKSGSKKPDEGAVDYHKVIRDLKSQHEDALQKALAEKEKEMKDFVLNSSLNAIKGMVKNPSEHETKFKFLKSQFSGNEFDLQRTDDGNFIVVDLETKKPLHNDDYSHKTVAQVMMEKAQGLLPITVEVPTGGRRGNEAPPATASGFEEYKDLADFVKRGLIEKGITKDHPQYLSKISEFRKAQAKETA